MKRCGLFLSLVSFAALLLSSCASPLPSATSAPSPMAATRRFTATRTLTSTLIPSSTPSLTPTLPAVSPIATGTGFWITSWSPDSTLLAYRSFTPDDVANNPYEGTAILPYGTFHLLNVHTGEECQYPKDNEYGLQFNLWHAWLPDGRLMTLNQAGQVVALKEPCDGRTVSPLDDQSRPACLVTNPDSNQTCSPDGARLATTDETDVIHTTTVVRTATSEVEAVIRWPYSWDGIGHIGGPAWLDSDRFIIHATDDGPLLVTLDRTAQVQTIAPTFFNLAGTVRQYATGAIVSGTQTFHLLLNDAWTQTTPYQLWLYHSESGMVERLSAAYAYLSSDGRWLELRDEDSNPAWVRPVDPPNREAQQYLTAEDQNYPGWSSDWRRVAVARQSAIDLTVTLRALAMPEGRLLRVWSLGRHIPNVPLWSPDNRFLAVIGYRPSDNEQALFLLSLQP